MSKHIKYIYIYIYITYIYIYIYISHIYIYPESLFNEPYINIKKVKTIISEKVNVTNNARFFLSQTPTHLGFT